MLGPMKPMLAALCLVLVSATASAAPAPERLAAAKQLAQTMGLKDQMNAGFNAMLPMIDQQAASLNLDATQKAELQAVFKAWYTEDLDQDKMLENIIVLYAETFSELELKELNTFYSTAVGKRILTALPEIMQKAALLGMKEAESKQGLLMDRLNKFRAAHGK